MLSRTVEEADVLWRARVWSLQERRLRAIPFLEKYLPSAGSLLLEALWPLAANKRFCFCRMSRVFPPFRGFCGFA